MNKESGMKYADKMKMGTLTLDISCQGEKRVAN